MKLGFRSIKVLITWKAVKRIVVFPLNQIQNFEAVLNSCSNNNLNQPGGTFLEFFVFCVYFM